MNIKQIISNKLRLEKAVSTSHQILNKNFRENSFNSKTLKELLLIDNDIEKN